MTLKDNRNHLPALSASPACFIIAAVSTYIVSHLECHFCVLTAGYQCHSVPSPNGDQYLLSATSDPYKNLFGDFDSKYCRACLLLSSVMHMSTFCGKWIW